MNYARAIRVARAVHGITQSELAERAKCNGSYISLLESGERTPSTAMTERIARALRVPQHVFVLLALDARDVKKLSTLQMRAAGHEVMEFLGNSTLTPLPSTLPEDV